MASGSSTDLASGSSTDLASGSSTDLASGSSTDSSKGSCMRHLLKKLPIIILLQYAFATYRGKSFDWLCVVLHLKLDAFLFLTEEYRSNVLKSMKVSFRKFVWRKKSHNA
ncbi:hypothetical protein MKW92_000907 [Papaver armeniacum]|nr:hypothetical protein MKW92_000907 [Papaver armeniacum]